MTTELTFHEAQAMRSAAFTLAPITRETGKREMWERMFRASTDLDDLPEPLDVLPVPLGYVATYTSNRNGEMLISLDHFNDYPAHEMRRDAERVLRDLRREIAKHPPELFETEQEFFTRTAVEEL